MILGDVGRVTLSIDVLPKENIKFERCQVVIKENEDERFSIHSLSKVKPKFKRHSPGRHPHTDSLLTPIRTNRVLRTTKRTDSTALT